MESERLDKICEEMRTKRKLHPGCRWPDCFRCVYDDCYEDKPMTEVDHMGEVIRELAMRM